MSEKQIQDYPFLILSEYLDFLAKLDTKELHTYEDKMYSFIHDGFDLHTKIKSNLTLDKKFFNQIQKATFSSLSLIAEPWCLDACAILPMLEAIQAINDQIQIRVYLRDSHDLIDEFLTNGSKSIPVLFGLDHSSNVLFKWGPRVKPAQDIASSLKDESYKIKQAALIEWYIQDNGQSFQTELIDFI